MKHSSIIGLLLLVTGISICGEYTEFEYDSVTGEYPNFMKPMKANMLKEKHETAEKVKNKINSESYQMLKDSIDEFDKDTIEVFSNNNFSIFSISIMKVKSNSITVKEELHSFVNSTKRIGGEKNLQLNHSQPQIAGHTFSRVDIKPSYRQENLTTSLLVNQHADMKYMILILADGNTYKTEIDRFLDKLRFKQ